MGIGALSILTLPVSQYPQIAPPTVMISANYPGASAETLARTVAAVELQLSAEVNPFLDKAIERFDELWRARSSGA